MEVERVRDKVFEERPGFPTQYGPDRPDRQPGSPPVPHETYRDLVTVLLLTAMLFFLTAAIVPSLEKPRNPAETPFIVPDWYVLFSYGLLKLVVITPVLAIPGDTALPRVRRALHRPAAARVRADALVAGRPPDGGVPRHPRALPPDPRDDRRLVAVRARRPVPGPPHRDHVRPRLRRHVAPREERPAGHHGGRGLPGPVHPGAVVPPVVLRPRLDLRHDGGPRPEHAHGLRAPDLLVHHGVHVPAAAVQHVRVPPERVLPVRELPPRLPRHEGRGRRDRRPEPRVQLVQEAARRRADVDVPRVRRVQGGGPARTQVQRLHPRGTRKGYGA